MSRDWTDSEERKWKFKEETGLSPEPAGGKAVKLAQCVLGALPSLLSDCALPPLPLASGALLLRCAAGLSLSSHQSTSGPGPGPRRPATAVRNDS